MMMLRSQSSFEQGPRVLGWPNVYKLENFIEVLFSFTFSHPL